MNKLLKELLAEFNLNDQIIDKLNIFYNLVIEENKKYNLTAITNEEDFVIKHFYDAYKGNEYIDFKNIKNLFDLGPGAGFPSIPLALIHEDITFYLIETNKKRCSFLNLVKDKLQLNNLKIINSRIEELPNSYREFFDIGICRAVAETRILVELMIPFIKVGAKLCCYKGNNVENELKLAKKTLLALNSEIDNKIIYKLPLIEYERTFIIIKKNKITDLKYPRNYSLISKKSI